MLRLLIIKISLIAKTLGFLSRLSGRGEGTSINGLIVEKYFPSILKYYNKKYKKVVFISGTNGKSTSRSAITNILESNNLTVCSNARGANIYRGIAAALLEDTRANGSLKSDYLILEVEEATLPRLSKYIQPDILLLTNIFRDQLDAYGEVDKTLSYFKEALDTYSEIKSNTSIVANMDDNKLLSSIEGWDQATYGFGLSDDLNNLDYEKSEEVVFNFNQTYKIESFENNLATSTEGEFEWTLEGVYNLYNAIAAIAVVRQILNNSHDIFKGLATLEPMFGRGEEFKLEGDKTAKLYLVKNPAGFNQVLDLINNNYGDNSLLAIGINDNIADGRDVSWLWDVKFEQFIDNNNWNNRIFTTGSRRLDMLARLNITNYNTDLSQAQDISTIVNTFLSSEYKRLIICSTYTNVKEVRDGLNNQTN